MYSINFRYKLGLTTHKLGLSGASAMGRDEWRAIANRLNSWRKGQTDVKWIKLVRK